jgi:multiple sugar transport system permease protein/N-acetylglucosamine transport system permease protein
VVSQFILTPVSLLLAYFFFKKMPGHKIFRIMFFIPSLIPGIVVTMLYGFMLDSTFGVFNNFLTAVGLGRFIPVNGWFGSGRMAQNMILVFVLWSGAGGGIILLSANLNRFPAEIFESARIDGAPMRTELFRIVLPLIWPIISLMIVTGCMIVFNVYLPPMILTNGGPNGETKTIAFIVMEWTTSQYQEYMAAAAGILFSLVGIPFILLIKWGMAKITPVVEY